MSNNVKPKYEGPLKSFYPVVELIAKYLGMNIDEFAALKAMYTAAMVASLKAKIAAAKALPTTAKGLASRTTAKVDMMAGAEKIRLLFLMLKSFITQVFPEDKWEAEFKKAGSAYYGETSNVWTANASMAEEAGKYIFENKDKLKGPHADVMPDAFPDEFERATNEYNDLLLGFGGANKTKKDYRKDKIKANNEVYDIISGISRDAAIVYKKNPEGRQDFSYTYQLSVWKNSAASFQGTITLNGVPVEGVSIGSTEGKYEAISDRFGKFSIKKMLHGDYIFVIAKQGLVTQEIAITLKPGRRKSVRIKMVEMVVEVAA